MALTSPESLMVLASRAIILALLPPPSLGEAAGWIILPHSQRKKLRSCSRRYSCGLQAQLVRREKEISGERCWTDLSFFLEKHTWADTLYRAFVKHVAPGAAPYPLNVNICVAFVRFLARSRYSLGTIKSVLVASVKRLHCLHTNVTNTPPEITRAFGNAMTEVAKQFPGLHKHQSRAPCRIDDLKAIIGSFPPGHNPGDHAAKASNFLMAGHTGARAITMINVKLGNIKAFTKSSDRTTVDSKLLWTVQILYEVTKNNPAWNHTVTLEGLTDVRDDGDAVYWLEQHLQQRWKRSLHDFNKWKDNLSAAEKDHRLWDWVLPTSMAAAFSKAAEEAGFPRHYFSYHSLRAGFICSALQEATLCDNPKDRQTVIERTAAIAGWKAGGPAQMGYLKDQATATIIATRVVGGGPANAERPKGT